MFKMRADQDIVSNFTPWLQDGHSSIYCLLVHQMACGKLSVPKTNLGFGPPSLNEKPVAGKFLSNYQITCGSKNQLS